jgi:hypothetical protein
MSPEKTDQNAILQNYQVPNSFFGYNYGYARQNGSFWIDNKKEVHDD